MTHEHAGREFFDDKYARSDDPWSFASAPYELARYETTVQALSNRRYRRAFEPGCSIGVLTSSLAHFCENVEALDISPIAVERAQERCRELSNVTIRCGALPAAIPEGDFDLIVLSEVGYYFSEPQLQNLAEALVSRITPGGNFLAVHWLGVSAEHVLSGDRVHDVLRSASRLQLEKAERHDAFRLDKWIRL